ncbi:CatB-related O-acetyltransferase [Maricurvus nonylphenolicus]|uniref:CatB-related O-acetyltransferase n=1 Tax=Maricurvus nonylphenolicus TaxID=1008307 RepID=UPI0036F2EC27
MLRKIVSKFKKRKTRKLNRFDKQTARFYEQYPDYTIGVGTYGIPVVWDWQEGSTLRIGSYCSISANVQIFLGGNHRTDWISSYPFSHFLEDVPYIPDSGVSKGDVTVGSDVWLCANAIILSGITIGHGAVVANGAVVTRDVEPYSIVGGNPAKVIGWRFSETEREKLLQSAWWDWPVEEVKSIHQLLNADNLQPFWDYLERRKN